MNEAMLIVVVVGDEGEQHQSHDTTRVKKGEIQYSAREEREKKKEKEEAGGKRKKRKGQ